MYCKIIARGNAPCILYLGQINHFQSLTIKIQQQIAGFSTSGLKLQEKRRIEQFNFFGFAFKCYKVSCFKWL